MAGGGVSVVFTKTPWEIIVMVQVTKIPVETLAEVVCSPSSIIRIIAMVTAYIDESGTHAGCPAMTVAGWLAPVQQWNVFEKEWVRCLEEAGISIFHMTDYENRQGDYKDWTEEKRVNVLKALHAICHSPTTIPFSSSIPIDFYKKIRPQYICPDSPYAFCLSQCLLQIEKWANSVNHQEPIAYVFERGSGLGNDIIALLQSMSEDPIRNQRFRLGTWTFAGKKDFCQLQAADLLAYESNKEMLNAVIPGQPTRRMRKSAINLITGRKEYCVFFGKYNLERALTLQKQ
jgi:hypothetical protein